MLEEPGRHALRQGFTLLELSIVLAIIGLLVGGIAGMRSYVKNAELTTIMNESKFYISAFNQFQTKYNAPPGDYSTASANWATAGNGDGNGIIRAISGPNAPNTAEYYYVFQHLALGGFIPGSYTGAANSSGGATAGTNVPASAVDNVTYLFDHPNALDGLVSGDAFYPTGSYGNILRVAAVGANSSTIPSLPFLSGKQAIQLDTKYDDGGPYTGNIVSPGPGALAKCATDPNNYRTSDDKVCYLILKFQ